MYPVALVYHTYTHTHTHTHTHSLTHTHTHTHTHVCVCVHTCTHARHTHTHETKPVCGWWHQAASGVGVQNLERGDVVVSKAADAGEEAESRDTILLLELEHAHCLVQAPVVRPSLVASCNTVDCPVYGVIVLVEGSLGAAAVVPGRHVQELHGECVCLCVKCRYVLAM